MKVPIPKGQADYSVGILDINWCLRFGSCLLFGACNLEFVLDFGFSASSLKMSGRDPASRMGVNLRA